MPPKDKPRKVKDKAKGKQGAESKKNTHQMRGRTG
jgi:hypothetical protein